MLAAHRTRAGTETLETHARLGGLKLPIGRVIVNRVHGRRFPPELVARVREGGVAATGKQRELLEAVADRAAEESGRAEINAEQLERLRKTLAAEALVEIPFLYAEEFGAGELEQIAHTLEPALAVQAGGAKRARRGATE